MSRSARGGADPLSPGIVAPSSRRQRERQPGEDDDIPLPTDDDYAEPSRARVRQAADARTGARVLTMANVQPRAVDWLWRGRLPAGMVAVLDGEPAAGKSTFVIDLIARITTGREFPDEPAGHGHQPADVVLVGHEDSPEHTIRPRLDAAGADAARVHLITDIGGRSPQLPDDGVTIEREVRERGARLLVFDPISAYIGKADFHRDNEVRAALAPLVTIAESTGVVVLMLRHFRKNGGTNAMGRGLGSIAVTAVARTALMLGSDPEDAAVRVVAWSKLSVAAVPPSLRWRFDGKGDRPPRIEWLGTCALTADALVAAKDRRERGGAGAGDDLATASGAAEAWLMNQLEADGALPVNDLKARAAEANHSWRTVERVKGRLGVKTRRESDGQTGAGRWLWVAPERKSAKDARLAGLGETGTGEGRNQAENADLGTNRKTANAQDRQTSLAALRNPSDSDDEADLLEALP